MADKQFKPGDVLPKGNFKEFQPGDILPKGSFEELSVGDTLPVAAQDPAQAQLAQIKQDVRRAPAGLAGEGLAGLSDLPTPGLNFGLQAGAAGGGAIGGIMGSPFGLPGIVGGATLGASPFIAMQELMHQREPEKFDPPASISSMIGLVNEENPIIGEFVDNAILGPFSFLPDIFRAVKNAPSLAKAGQVASKVIPKIRPEVVEGFKTMGNDLVRAGVKAGEELKGFVPDLHLGSSNDLIKSFITLLAPGEMTAIANKAAVQIEKSIRRLGDIPAFRKVRMLRKGRAVAINKALRGSFRGRAKPITATEFPTNVAGGTEFIIAVDDQVTFMTNRINNKYGFIGMSFKGRAHKLSAEAATGIEELYRSLKDRVVTGPDPFGFLGNTLESLKNSAGIKVTTLRSGKEVVEVSKELTFDQMKNLRTTIRHKINNDSFKNPGEFNLIGLKNIVSGEMDRLIAAHPNSANIIPAYREANALVAEKYSIYDHPTQVAFAGSMEKMWDVMFKNSESMEDFTRTVSEFTPKGKKAFQARREEALARLLQKHKDVDGVIDIDAARKMWEDPNFAAIPQAFTVSQRKSIDNVLAAAERGRLGTTKGMNQNFWIFRGGVALIQMSKVAAATLIGAGGGLGPLLASGGSIALVVGTEQIAAKTLLNPLFGEAAIGMMKAAPNSKVHTKFSKTMFSILKGSKLLWEVNDGKGNITQIPIEPEKTRGRLTHPSFLPI